MCFAARKMEFPDIDSTNYAASAQKLHNEFTSRFPEFRRDEIKLKLFAHPFNLGVEDSSDDCQKELIELQAVMDTKRGYSEKSGGLLHTLCLLKVSQFVPSCKKNHLLFGSTYYCEQLFNKMKLTITRCQSQLTDEHLTSQLWVATTSVKADIDKLCKYSKFQVSHKMLNSIACVCL